LSRGESSRRRRATKRSPDPVRRLDSQGQQPAASKVQPEDAVRMRIPSRCCGGRSRPSTPRGCPRDPPAWHARGPRRCRRPCRRVARGSDRSVHRRASRIHAPCR